MFAAGIKVARWLLLCSVGVCAATALAAEPGWVHYGASQQGGQYSALAQIDRHNVDQLAIAWIYRTGELGQGASRGFAFQSNPILVAGRLYVTTGSGIVIALQPTTGTELWRYDPHLDRSRHPAETGNRGVSSWIDAQRPANAACHHRLYVGILDSRLIALDGRTGKPCSDFGAEGTIWLNKDVRLRESRGFEYTLTSPPVIVGDTLVIGSAIGDNRATDLELGIVRGIDARSGTLRWSWDPIPRAATRAAHSSWRPQEVAHTGAANAWAPLAADTERNLVYVPTGSASPDFYGGEREGDNLHANSLVALDASSGELRWARQLVHHDVWDYDLPAQPVLAELRHAGKLVPAVIQTTKMGLVFTFNRLTGEPIFPIEERPVPQGGVAGEHLSPTQPFPVAPPPIVRHSVVDDAFGLLLFDKWACADKLAALRSEGIYTPPSLQGTVMRPGYGGGSNWGGLAFSPQSQLAVVNAMELPLVVTLIPRQDFAAQARSDEFPDSEYASQTGTPYGMRREALLSPLGVPCTSPPWGTLTGIDMEQGKIKWQVPLGTIEDIAPAMVPNLALGVPNTGGPIITGSGLIFIGAAMDNYLRAFAADSGEELWKGRLPAGGQATPMTYSVDGKQYVVIAAGGHPGLGSTPGDYLVAFALGE